MRLFVAEGSNLRQKRWFVPLNETRFDQEIPVEWEAWLRYRRSEPPMPEEIEANRIVQQQTIKNAKKLSGQRKLVSVIWPFDAIRFRIYLLVWIC